MKLKKNDFILQVHKCDCNEDTDLADILSAVCKHMRPAANVSNLRFGIYFKVLTSFSGNNDQHQKNPSFLLPFCLHPPRQFPHFLAPFCGAGEKINRDEP